jgi:hypothetical protein
MLGRNNPIVAVLAQPWADSVLSGAATIDQLRSNLEALAVPWDDEAAGRLRTLAEAPDEYWQGVVRWPGTRANGKSVPISPATGRRVKSPGCP